MIYLIQLMTVILALESGCSKEQDMERTQSSTAGENLREKSKVSSNPNGGGGGGSSEVYKLAQFHLANLTAQKAESEKVDFAREINGEIVALTSGQSYIQIIRISNSGDLLGRKYININPRGYQFSPSYRLTATNEIIGHFFMPKKSSKEIAVYNLSGEKLASIEYPTSKSDCNNLDAFERVGEDIVFLCRISGDQYGLRQITLKGEIVRKKDFAKGDIIGEVEYLSDSILLLIRKPDLISYRLEKYTLHFAQKGATAAFNGSALDLRVYDSQAIVSTGTETLLFNVRPDTPALAHKFNIGAPCCLGTTDFMKVNENEFLHIDKGTHYDRPSSTLTISHIDGDTLTTSTVEIAKAITFANTHLEGSSTNPLLFTSSWIDDKSRESNYPRLIELDQQFQIVRATDLRSSDITVSDAYDSVKRLSNGNVFAVGQMNEPGMSNYGGFLSLLDPQGRAIKTRAFDEDLVGIEFIGDRVYLLLVTKVTDDGWKYKVKLVRIDRDLNETEIDLGIVEKLEPNLAKLGANLMVRSGVQLEVYDPDLNKKPIDSTSLNLDEYDMTITNNSKLVILRRGTDNVDVFAMTNDGFKLTNQFKLNFEFDQHSEYVMGGHYTESGELFLELATYVESETSFKGYERQSTMQRYSKDGKLITTSLFGKLLGEDGINPLFCETSDNELFVMQNEGGEKKHVKLYRLNLATDRISALELDDFLSPQPDKFFSLPVALGRIDCTDRSRLLLPGYKTAVHHPMSFHDGVVMKLNLE